MEGFHCAPVGGVVRNWEQEFARILLPPGQYIVFANVQVAIGSASSDPLETAYQVVLEAGGARNEYIGGLRYDGNDPGSRSESIALSVAVTRDSEFVATLTVSATTQDRLYAWYPRLTAIQLDRLHIQCDSRQVEDERERRLMEASLVASSAQSGFPIEAIVRGLK